MSILRLLAALSLFGFIGCMTNPQQVPRAESAGETLFVGGTVTVGPNPTPKHGIAILVRDGVIFETGEADALRPRHGHAGGVDASNATVLPGLTDAHGHLYGLGVALDTVNLVGPSSYDEVINRVKERAAHASPGEWILGRGWAQNRWPTKDFPTKEALDTAIPDHPVWLRRVDGHAGLANSAALRAAGITAATHDPDGGRILRDDMGEPSGVFIDTAQALVDGRMPAESFELRKKRILAAAHAIAANGLTEMHDAGAEGETIRAVRELIDEKRFPIRVYMMVSDNVDLLRDWFKRGPLLDYGHRLTIRSVKLYADGALGSRGAALLAPYNDDPGNSGLEIAKPPHLYDVAQRAIAAGFQVNTHAIADRR